jgi:cytochrome oxidase assembly protein ShyY1
VFGFLRQPRWIALTVFAVLIVGVCFRLGIWQLDRLDGRREANDLVREASALPPQPLGSLIGSDRPPTLRYRSVIARGRYDATNEVVLYGRALDGRPGDHLLTPLILPGGRAIVVDRGWVPAVLDSPPPPAAAPPAGEVTIRGSLAPTESGGADDAPEGGQGRATTFTRVDLEAIDAQVPYDVVAWYVVLQEQSPAQSGDLPITVDLPTLDEGPHLSYAFQWFAFATIAAIGYVILVRREVLDRRGSDRGGDAYDADRLLERQEGSTP